MKFKKIIIGLCLLINFNCNAVALGRRMPETIIKVGILSEQRSINIRSYGKSIAVDLNLSKRIKLSPAKGYLITPYNGGIKIGEHFLSSRVRFVSKDKKELIRFNGRRYRGTIIVKNKNDTLTMINELGIDGYLFGVLPMEVSPSWPIESLKAQAIVSRTYAINNMGKFKSRGYDLSSDIFSQVYRGMEVEDPRSNRAVKETVGKVLTYNRQITKAYFFSNCGGVTSDVRNVWGNPIKHMQGVICPYCKPSPRYHWEQHISPQFLKDKLNAAGHSVGDIKDIRFLSRTKSGRVGDMKIIHSAGKLKVTGHRFRMAVSPNIIKSTLMMLDRSKENFHFYGRGWGHGVGMCQWGAKGLAERGKSYEYILRFYFPGTRVRKWRY